MRKSGSVIRLNSLARFGAVLLAIPLIGACTTLIPETAPQAAGIDYRTADLASLVVVIDVPATLQPVPETTVVAFAEAGISVPLALIDPGDVAASLPPPAFGRSYYLFGFAETDRAAIRQAAAASRPTVAPRFCALDALDPKREHISVLLALPGSGTYETVVSEESVASGLSRAGEKLIAC